MNIPRVDNFVLLYSEDRAFHLRKLEPNGSVCLDRFFICEVVCGRGGLSRLRIVGRTFGGLGMQDQPGKYSVSKFIQ